MANPMANVKALVVGGGVGGPALAYWLAKAGASVVLAERSPALRATGQQIDLRSHGVTMMRLMGIEEQVRAATVKESGFQIVDTRGRTKAFFPARESGTGKQSITSEFEIMRGDLVRILYGLTEGQTAKGAQEGEEKGQDEAAAAAAASAAAAAPRVRHEFDTMVESMTQDSYDGSNAGGSGGGKVHVRFRDGREEDFDLVVAADGTGSKTRRLMLGPDAPDPRRRVGDGYIAYWSIPSRPGDSDRFTWCLIPGKRVARILSTRKDCPELTRVYVMTKGTDAAMDAAHEEGSQAKMKEAISALYADAGWESERFLSALRDAPEADDLYWTPFEHVCLPEGDWSRGRVVLLGDAAHSQTANGIGTSTALIGAYILAGEIASRVAKAAPGTPPTAAVVDGIAAYEAVLRPIVSEKPQTFSFPRANWSIALTHALAKAATYFNFDMTPPNSKLDKWQLPRYPVLDDAKM